MLLKEYFALNGGDGSVNYGKFAMFYNDKLPFIHKIEDLLRGMGFIFTKCSGDHHSSEGTSAGTSQGTSAGTSAGTSGHPHSIKWIVNADPETVRMHFTSKGFNPDGGLAQDKQHLAYGALRICICRPVEPGKTILKLC